MVQPARSRGRGRDGFGARWQGRGVGYTGGKGFVWQCTENNRREEVYDKQGSGGGNPEAQGRLEGDPDDMTKGCGTNEA